MVMTCLKDENALIVVFDKDDLWMAAGTGLDGICSSGFTRRVLDLHVQTDLVLCEQIRFHADTVGLIFHVRPAAWHVLSFRRGFRRGFPYAFGERLLPCLAHSCLLSWCTKDSDYLNVRHVTNTCTSRGKQMYVT